jgi:cation transport regulator ChaC
MADDTWVFGYGSLVWRPAFESLEQRAAILPGFARRYWQGSTDHRGVPESPGRVVTLVDDDEERCVGLAYRLADTVRDEVLARLDHREKGGYERIDADLHWLEGGEGPRAIVYFAAEGNPNWLGPADVGAIAEQVARSRGPSGHNAEYVLRLRDALRALGADDAHCFDVAAAVEALS